MGMTSQTQPGSLPGVCIILCIKVLCLFDPGLEVTQWLEGARGELHISGDVVFAIMQYYWATGDVTIFTNDVYDDIITGVADFWISKLVLNETLGKYVTLGKEL
jgi:trehalose/maltose hydrolase-like predicted phosphorylase